MPETAERALHRPIGEETMKVRMITVPLAINGVRHVRLES